MFDGWWLPPAISRHATAHDVQFVRTLVVVLIIFVASQCALAVISWHFRSASRRAERTPAPVNNRRELAWMAATAIVFLGLLAMGARTWASVQFTAAPRE